MYSEIIKKIKSFFCKPKYDKKPSVNFVFPAPNSPFKTIIPVLSIPSAICFAIFLYHALPEFYFSFLHDPASHIACVNTTQAFFFLILENLSSTFLISVQCIKYYSRWCFLMMCFYMKPHFVLYAALSKNQTCNYANMYAFIIIKFYCKWLMHINLIL